MEKRIKERYSDAILQKAIERFGIQEDKIKLLDGFESFIYEFERDGGEYILRIGHSSRRSEAHIQGEVDWINYLAAGGAGVSRSISSGYGQLVEHIDDGQGEKFLATAFVKAQGTFPSQVGWTDELYETYGRAIGQMHALAKDYQPANPAWARPDWDDDAMMIADKSLPDSDVMVIKKYEELLSYLKSLPKDKDSYGLTHFDPHGGNFYVDEQRCITLFDFDDCAYCWFAHDIAIVLFYLVNDAEDKPAFTDKFMSIFLKGYAQDNQIDPKWLKEIPYFLKLREIDLYAVIHRSFDVENLDHPWVARYMDGRKEKIENEIPFVDFDFTTLAKYL